MAFGASRRNYSAPCNFYADKAGPPNRIIWYPVSDGTPIYEGPSVFWPRLDTPPNEATSAYELEGKGGIVRRQNDAGDIYHRPGDHAHGTEDDFDGETKAGAKWGIFALLLTDGKPLLLDDGKVLKLQQAPPEPCPPIGPSDLSLALRLQTLTVVEWVSADWPTCPGAGPLLPFDQNRFIGPTPISGNFFYAYFDQPGTWRIELSHYSLGVGVFLKHGPNCGSLTPYSGSFAARVEIVTLPPGEILVFEYDQTHGSPDLLEFYAVITPN